MRQPDEHDGDTPEPLIGAVQGSRERGNEGSHAGRKGGTPQKGAAERHNSGKRGEGGEGREEQRGRCGCSLGWRSQ